MTNENFEKDLIYVTGHRHPDTDSIVSAIAYAGLKRTQGQAAIACRLGSMNAESTYLLKRFNQHPPMLFKSAKATLEEIEMDSPLRIRPETTIYEALNLIHTNHRQTLAVVNEHDQLLGIVTSSNLSLLAMGDTALGISMLTQTPVEYIAKTIKGQLIYAPEHFHFNGKVSIVAIAEHKLENYELKDRLVIIGNDKESQLQAIEKGASCIIAVWTDEIDPEVISLAKLQQCAIIISGHGTMNTSRYLYFSPPVKLIMTTELVSFNKDEDVEDVGKRMLKTRFRSYPVIDDKNRIRGFVSRYHILNSRHKQVIMVDHNEYSQSVEGIEVADLLEIIDHHRISDFSTTRPIMFRNEIIGSTSSIVALMYEEHNLEITQDLAGLLLGAIISDTLNFKSPTTTVRDLELAKRLAKIAGLDIDQFAMDIFSVSSTIKHKTIEEIINHDIKAFTLSDLKVMVGQVTLYHLDELKSIRDEIEGALDRYAQANSAQLCVLVFTSVIDHGSVFFGGGKRKDLLLEAYPDRKDETHSFYVDILSRKNQIIPRLAVTIEEYK